MNELAQEHARGGHSVPAFGCPTCIQMRDYWACACGDLRLGSVNSCNKCGRQNPAYQRRRRNQ